MMLTTSVFVLVILDDAMDGQVQTENEEECRADMTEPFLESLHLTGQFTDAYCTITYQPCNKHDRQTCSETEDYRHEPVPCVRQRQRDIYHRQEIDESVRAESDREEDTEDERPEPTLFAVRFFEPFADAVVVLVVMMTAEKQHDTADEHKARQNRFAVVPEYVLDTFCLRAHQKRDTQQNIGG